MEAAKASLGKRSIESQQTMLRSSDPLQLVVLNFPKMFT
jgi:hypothetical protein